MAKVYLDRLRKRHGWTGGSYRELMRKIVEANHDTVSRQVAARDAAWLRRRAESRAGQVMVPPMDELLPASRLYARKAAVRGDLMADALRDKLSKNLRDSLAEYMSGAAQGKRGQNRGRMDAGLVNTFEQAIQHTFESYTRRQGGQMPTNVRTIAETELRCAVSEVKHLYAEALVNANPGKLELAKRWVHHPHLSDQPRDGHASVDGRMVSLNQGFKVPLTRRTSAGVKVLGFTVMQYPHDPSAPPEQVINCHCECDYVVVVKQPNRMPEDGVVFKARRLAGRIDFQGLPISLEHRKGGVRTGTDPDGNEWRTKMLFPYGYIRGTEGVDGDEVDCFVGDDRDSEAVFIVHTYKPGTVQYDEDKVMLGFTSAVEARRWLEAHYDRYVVQSVEETDVDGLKGLLEFCSGERLEVAKDASAGRGMVAIGQRMKKPDGSTWERTGPYSYKKVLNPDGTPYESRSKGTNQGHGGKGSPAAAPTAAPPENGMTSDRAQEILEKYGYKGRWNLTRDGLDNWLRRHGVDPSKLKFTEKHDKLKELLDSGAKFGAPAGAPAAPAKAPPKKRDPMEPEPGMTASEADAMLKSGIGKIWGLTAQGLNNWLRSRGVDPTTLKFKEKHEKVKALVKEEFERDKVMNTVKLRSFKPYTNESFDHSKYGGTQITVDGQFLFLDKPEDMAKAQSLAKPVRGGHWGSARSDNRVARAVAWSSAPSFRPLDAVRDGKLVVAKGLKLDVSEVHNALGLRKYAQDRIGGLSRDKQPNFFRGMTLDVKDWDSIAKGESDTIELTGCTAFSCFEKIADRYSASKWTKSFGKDRKSVKIVLERDDDVDSSVGMWHPTFSEQNGGTPQPAFELLLGLEAVRVVRVEGSPYASKSTGAGAVDEKKEVKRASGYHNKAVATADYNAKIYSADMKRLEEDLQKPKDERTYSWMSDAEIQRNIEYKRVEAKKLEKALELMSKVNLDSPKAREGLKRIFDNDRTNPDTQAVHRMIQLTTMRARTESDIDSLGTVADKTVFLNSLVPSEVDRLKAIGFLDDGLDATDLYKGLIMSWKYMPTATATAIRKWASGDSGSGGSRLILHCVAGRGKKGVTGGDEGSPDDK